MTNINNDDEIYYSEDLQIQQEKHDRSPSVASKNSKASKQSKSSTNNFKQQSRTQNFNYKPHNDSTISTPSTTKTSHRKQSISSHANTVHQNDFSSVSASKISSPQNNKLENQEQIDYNSNII